MRKEIVLLALLLLTVPLAAADVETAEPYTYINLNDGAVVGAAWVGESTVLHVSTTRHIYRMSTGWSRIFESASDERITGLDWYDDHFIAPVVEFHVNNSGGGGGGGDTVIKNNPPPYEGGDGEPENGVYDVDSFNLFYIDYTGAILNRNTHDPAGDGLELKVYGFAGFLLSLRLGGQVNGTYLVYGTAVSRSNGTYLSYFYLVDVSGDSASWSLAKVVWSKTCYFARIMGNTVYANIGHVLYIYDVVGGTLSFRETKPTLGGYNFDPYGIYENLDGNFILVGKATDGEGNSGAVFYEVDSELNATVAYLFLKNESAYVGVAGYSTGSGDTRVVVLDADSVAHVYNKSSGSWKEDYSFQTSRTYLKSMDSDTYYSLTDQYETLPVFIASHPMLSGNGTEVHLAVVMGGRISDSTHAYGYLTFAYIEPLPDWSMGEPTETLTSSVSSAAGWFTEGGNSIYVYIAAGLAFLMAVPVLRRVIK